MMKNASARNLWGDYLDAHLEYASEQAPKVNYFCDNEKDANTSIKLINKGLKKATAHSLLGLQLRNEPLPKIGDFRVVTNWEGQAKSIVRTISVKMTPFFNIDEHHALMEGEGDKSLAYWKKNHWDYYTRELAPYNRVPRESMIIVCEVFEKVF